jgi:hypothetical protein
VPDNDCYELYLFMSSGILWWAGDIWS